MSRPSLRFVIGFVCLCLFLLSFAITITINSTWLYRYAIDKLAILQWTTLSKEELMHSYHQLLAFLNFPWVKTLQLADFPMSQSGLSHFVDVKKLFLLNYAVAMITLIPAGSFLYTNRKNQQEWQLIRPFQIASMVPVVFVFLMLFGFDRFFIQFHQLFFRNADWQFDPTTDPIINVLPEQFFMYCFILFFLLMEGFFIGGYFYAKKMFALRLANPNEKK